jgi:hypothetical protein
LPQKDDCIRPITRRRSPALAPRDRLLVSTDAVDQHLPVVGSSRVPAMVSSVLLPEPLGPITAPVQEDAEDDADGIGRDLGGDLVAVTTGPGSVTVTAAVLTLAGGLSALGTVAASAATLQCGNASVEVYSMKYATPSGWIGFCQMSR